MKSNCYFAVHTSNIQWFSTLVLNHNWVEELPMLIAHNFEFFGGFNHINFLNVVLRLRCGFNYRGVPVKCKNKYFSDLNYILEKRLRRTENHPPSNAVSYGKKYKGMRLNYFVSNFENCFIKEPTHNADYKISRSFILPDVQTERDELYRKRREGRLNNAETDSNFSHGSDKNIELDLPKLEIEDAPDFSLKPLSDEESLYIEKESKWIEENEKIILKNYKDLKINEFESMDVNHLNLPFIMRKQFLEIMNEGEEQKKVTERFFTFLYGVRVMSSQKELGHIDEFGESMRYVLRRVVEIGGIDLNTVPDLVQEKHFKMLDKINEINELAKISILDHLNGSINKEEITEKLYDLYYEKCLIMIEIRSLYTKYVYIQDCYLGRNTNYQLDFDFCGFIRCIKSMNNINEGMKSSSPDRRGLTVYEAGFSPSENEMKKSGRKKYTIKEAKETAAKFIAVAENEYEKAIEHSKAIMGEEWTNNFIENFSQSPVKNEDSRFVRLKQEYNCLIKTIKTWSDDDRDYYHMLLQEIFTYDEEFLKYMPKHLKEKMEEPLKMTSMFFSYVNSCCTNHPDYKENKLNLKTAPRLERSTDPIMKMFSEITGLNDNFEKGTVKGGVNIVDVGEDSEEKVNKKKMIRWRQTMGDAAGKVNSLVEEIVILYHYLGDALELTPWQLGLSPVNCNCDNKKVHIQTYKNTLMKNTNKIIKNKDSICNNKTELEMKKRRVESLKASSLAYENSIKENETSKVPHKSISEWVEIKKENRSASRTKTVGLETSNRFSCLYDDIEEIIEAEDMADKFLSVSENLNIVFDWKAYKAKNKYVRQKLNEEPFADCDRINKIKTNNGLSPLKKYNVKNIRDVLVIIQLCYNKKIHPDYKYLKEKYGIKRCQSKFLLTSLNITMRKMFELDAERKRQKLKQKSSKQS